ncbi:CapA family protein [Collinsella intestinalis]|uniref:CapA family protein n=1 Tax=Collinsella intestinalis TaxID=147207 RepID=UPI00195731DD|nr:CapA family protein [Collinsella intestinalis]MBM6907320.1 CapA family protein [Collinsella intestinalis]
MLQQRGDGAPPCVASAPVVSRRALLAAAGALGLFGAQALSGCAPAGKADAGRAADARQPGATSPSGLATVFDAEAAPRSLTLCMVGDILVHEGVWMSGESGGSRGYDHLFAQVKPHLRAADIAIVNQETILASTAFDLSGYPTFNGPVEIADAEAAAGVDVALAATNHALDMGFAGIKAELAYWRERHPEVVCTGIADSQADYDSVAMLERNGIKVAVLNFTESTNGIPVPAAAPYCVRLLDRAKVEADFAAARAAGADITVVCPHWGSEYALEPNAAQRAWAQVFCELGADAIIGTHTHVIEPVELLYGADGRRVPVFWSLGNFISWQNRKDTMVGGMAELAFEKPADGAVRVTSARLTPVVSHLALSPQMSTYPIAGYTEELARANAVRSEPGCEDFSLSWCHDFCRRVLGDGYDAAAGVYRLTM